MAKRSNQYPPSITLEGYTLSYRGEGVKKALIFDLYSAAFYTNDIITSTTDVIEKNVPKLLVTTILTPLLNGTLLSQIFKDALAKTYYGKLPDIQKDVEDILDVFKKGSIKRNDRFEFLFVPDKGFVAFQNGIQQYTCSNPILFKAIMEVYFGSYHRDQALCRKMAGI
ncbi:MAG: chalcone isomerase family protein [Chitinophagales bacterium]